MPVTYAHAQTFLTETFRSAFGATKLRCPPDEFHAHLREASQEIDAVGEGFLDPAKQRDLSIKFQWGHDHDFGDGHCYQGRMGPRHIAVLARFVAEFDLPLDLSGRRVLDIGVWTGGTSLLLTALGAEVIALEEVTKYCDVVNYLARSFGISGRLKCLPRSLYDALPRFADEFDFIIYSGVIYHVTDPLLSLRYAFNALKNNGVVYLETLAHDSPDSVCLYQGPAVIRRGRKELMNRGGWNYFVPSPRCLAAWCGDAGFQNVRIGRVEHSRLHGCAQRISFEDLCRAGLSRPNCR